MDKSTDKAQRPLRHYTRELPRFWITLPEPIVRRAFQDPLLSGLFPSHVGYFARARQHQVARSQPIPSAIFNYCVQGAGWCSLANARHEVRPGELMVVPAGQAHAYGTNPEQPWTVHWFHAMGTSLPRLLEHLGVSASSPVVQLGRSAELEALFVELREALEDDYSEYQLLYGSQVLTHLMGLMIRLRRDPRRGEATALHRVRATLEYLKRHLALPQDVAKLAALADLSPSHYSELVHACTGYPPKEYLARLRMHRAAQLLDTSELPVKAIAREVGFADPLHFSRVFRRINEQSPRQYRGARRASSGTSGSRPAR